MKEILKYILVYTLAFTGNIEAVAQVQPVDSTATRIMQQGMIMQPERVYMQFDNTSYLSGDTIWFNAFVTGGENDIHTTLSRMLHVELLSAEGEILQSQKKKIDVKGTCDGYIALDTLYHSGYYEVRSYTRYMLNWGDEAIFSRVFPIFGVAADSNEASKRIDAHSRKSHTGNEECIMRFYPEGGHLVYGLKSKVAFELTDGKGEWLQNDITLYANKEPLVKSKTVHNGKGIFTFTPIRDVQYSVKTMHKGEEYIFPLPTIEDYGTSINIDNGDSIRIVTLSNDTATTSLGFAIMHRNRLIFCKQPKQERDTITLSPDRLPEGVNRAIVYRNSIPLAERLFFVHHDKPLLGEKQTIKLNLTANGQELDTFIAQPYEKISIVAEREDGQPINENICFTVSATRNRRETSWGHNMYTYLLLGSELKGFIPYAGQYFDRNNKERKEHLDLIMLTHGWTAYDWEKLYKNTPKEIEEPEKGVVVHGAMYRKIKNYENGITTYNNVRDFPCCIELPGDNKSNFVTDSDGMFALQMNGNFYGKRNITISAAKKAKRIKDAMYGFRIIDSRTPEPRPYHHMETVAETDTLQFIIKPNESRTPSSDNRPENNIYNNTQEDDTQPSLHTAIEGYSRSKQFYSPDYSKCEPDSTDCRRTLYWSTNVRPMENGKLKAIFYNSSKRGSIKADIMAYIGNTLYSSAEEITTHLSDRNDFDSYIESAGNTDSISEIGYSKEILSYCRNQNKLGMLCYNRAEYDAAMSIFTELLKYNYPPAFTNIGIIFMNGTGYEKSLRRASQYFMVAAKMNEPTAQMHLGSMYAKGIYLAQSDSLALYWYMKSAKQGLAESQVATGRILMYSDHFKKDADAAAYWFREAAIKDHPDGLFMYGLYLNKYKYHFEDRELGNFYNCIQRAARLGHEDAQIELMMSSRQQRNYKVTLKWAMALHERGNNEGTRILAECYMLGRGVNKDYDRAKELYGEAAAKGDKEAKDILEDW